MNLHELSPAPGSNPGTFIEGPAVTAPGQRQDGRPRQKGQWPARRRRLEGGQDAF